MTELIVAMSLVVIFIGLIILVFLVMFRSSNLSGCSGDCNQGRRPCNCKKKMKDQIKHVRVDIK